ncbi:MAG: capsid protein [Cressdnaviricota sp.]|nr:MAG: capsid protein [Cressdnaviricota sp.]
MAMVPAYAARGMAMRAAGLAFRGASRAPRYKLPSWLRYANMAAAYSAGKQFLKDTRSARARASSITKSVFKKSRKRLQGQARAKRVAAARAVPSAPSSRVPAKYAVAPRMTKFRKTTVTKQKAPKSAIVHYKEFGQFQAQKCMYINHEHWGHVEKLWKGIAYGLTKTLLPYAKIYNGKSLEDPCIGPRTNAINNLASVQYDNKSSALTLRLVYFLEGADGEINRLYDDIAVEDISASPDAYLSFDAIATGVANSLKYRYQFGEKSWLVEAQFLIPATTSNAEINATPIYVQNLDDAEIHLYVNSLIKFQNVTPSDFGDLDKHSVDANPLIGRMYTAKGHFPQLDADLINAGDKTLDNYFGNVNDSTGGITLLGHANNTTPGTAGYVSANDIGRVSHIPNARELYGNQVVKTGTIHLAAGAMKFHKTTFTLKKTFRALAGIGFVDSTFPSYGGRMAHSSHTMFGFTCQHRHGQDVIKIGYNRDTDVGCYIKHKRIVHPLKTNYTLDNAATSCDIVPTEHL